MQKEKDQMYALSQELLGTRVPSSSYPIFLFEQFVWFKLRAVKEGRSFKITTSAKFLETFFRSNFEDYNFLCELCLHEMACPLDHHSNPVPFSRDVQLRAFASFVSNHAQWERSFQTFLTMKLTPTCGFKVSLRILVLFLLDTRVCFHVPSRLNT